MDTEDSSLDSILDTQPAPREQAPEATVETTGDKEPASAPPAAAPATPDDGPLVPRRALEDERRKRQDYEKRLAELEQRILASQQPPRQEQPTQQADWWADPESAAAMMQQETRYAIFETRLSLGEELMAAKPDYETAKAAFIEAAQADMSLAQKMVKSSNPAKFVYEQGRKISAMKEIGDDPVSYRAKIEAEVRASMGQQPASFQQTPKAPAPKSLAGTTSTAARDPQGRFASSSGPASLEDILG